MSVRMGRFWCNFILGLALVFGIASCDIAAFRPSQPLASVDPLPLPPLPEWIEQISPLDQADPLAQIRVRFKHPLIPIESLDSPDQQTQLSKFEVIPPIPGRFRFLTPRMVGFQADQALPKANRFRVTLKAGLADLNNHQLAQDLAWTFNTEAIALTNLPGAASDSGSEPEPFDLKPVFQVTSNVELDLNSLKERVNLIPEGSSESVPLKVELQKNSDESETGESYNDPQETFDPSQRSWLYSLTPQRELAKATRYKLEFAPGLRPTQGNLVSEMPFTSQLETYSPLAFEGLQYVGQPDAGGVYGRFTKGSAQLRFNNGLDAASAVENITIQPAPKEAPRSLQSYDGDTLINLNPWSLEPATTYTITLGANLKDQFGQTLGQPVTVDYETGDVAAELWAPSGLHIFPSTKDLQLNISTVNLPDQQYKAAYRVVQPTDLVYTDSAYPLGEGNDLLPQSSAWQTFPIQGTKNQSTEVAVPLREQLGGTTGMLAYGVQARANQYQQEGKTLWREPNAYGLVQLTNLGVFAQWFPESGLVRVHHLADGSPVNGAQVEIYQSKLGEKNQPTPVACATGRTDATGALLLTLEAMQRCIPTEGKGFTDPPNLLAIAREGQDWAFVRVQEWSGSYGYDVNTGWAGNRPETRGAIVSDRQLYQPGEKASFTGFMYYLQNGELRQGKNATYSVSLRQPDGSETSLGSQTTNAFGTFSLEVPLAATQPLGFYTIVAKSGDLEISGEFRVAEFKPPNFKVDLTLDKPFAVVGETVKAEAQSNYLFGPPVEEGQAEYYVTRDRAELSPPGWEEFSIGRQWFWPEEEPSVAADVLQTAALLDDQGKGSETITVADDLPYPMTYQVDVQVSDVSNLAVGNSQTFVALPSDRLIALKSDFVAEAGQPFEVTVGVINPQGETQANERVRVELQQMIYSNVTQVIEGSRTNRDQVEYKTVAQAETRSGKTPEPISLTATEAGAYRIRANFTNARNEATATDVQIWITGANEVNWGDRYTDERIDIQLDKETYQVGEMVNALIQSPYPDAELYFAVVRHDTLYKSVTQVKGGAPQIQFQVTPEMLPNAAIEVVLVRQGAPLEQVEPGSLEDLVRIGFAPFKVNLADQYLTVTATPQAESVAPSTSQTVQLTVQTPQGQPVQGQVTVMVVNEAVLQLTGYRPPDLVETVYAEQPISLRFADNRPDVVLQPLTSPIDKGWGFGGGYSTGAGNTRIRTNFQPLAYYNGSVLTDANGQATVTFPLPDNLTTWRVMVVATDGQLHFGNGETTFITTQPLITNAILPQFARPGDRLEAGLSVTNTTNQTGNLAIEGTLSGGLQADNTSLSQEDQAQSGTTAYRFPVVATTAGEASIQFSTKFNDESDAFRETLEVKPLAVTEQVVESGTTETQVQIPLKVDANVMRDLGGLDLSLASTLVADIQVPARQILQTEQLPFLELAASQLAIAANLQFLTLTYGQTDAQFIPVEQANAALEQLAKLQQGDGGFAAYPGGQQSDPFVTPYAARAIATARTTFEGVTAPATLQLKQDMVTRLVGYLQRILADPGQYEFCKEQPCKDRVRLDMLLALDELGTTRTDFLSELYERRAQFDPVMQIKLARYLSQFPDWQTEATDLTRQVQEAIAETGRAATVNLPSTWRWLSSPTVAQAEALRLFVTRQSDRAVVDRLVQGLLSQRRNGTWGNTYDTAEALTALVEYSQLQPEPPNFTATAQLAGKTLTSIQFRGYEDSSESLTVPMSELPQGENTLTLRKTGQGTLHYLAAYRYRLQGNPPGRFNGLRVTRTLRPANKPDVLKQYGLFDDEQPLTVKPGQVLDVGIEVITDHPVDHVLITDPLPAGLEAVDASFQTATPYFAARGDSWQIGYQTIYRDRVVAYGDHLEPGVYTLHYLVRSVTPGTFSYPGAEAHLQYAAEDFGRSTATTLEIAE
ncbi:MAG: alpha-2-macroglobulin [Oculatellaceae cyanobacterium bins.114]|nr:alpha-2-macroglobulin [Oculatellaceae cyanobacterium bins.114]